MMQWQFLQSRRNGGPILQVVTGMIGLVVIVALGLFALGAAAIIVVGLAVAFAIRRLLSGQSRQPAQAFHSKAPKVPTAHGNVIDGEYVVVDSEDSNASNVEFDRKHVDRRGPSIR